MTTPNPTPAYADGGGRVVYCGDALEVLRAIPSESVNCCVTSPPYWGLRDFFEHRNHVGDILRGRAFEAKLTFAAVMRRVLRRDGTCWVNMGDVIAVPSMLWCFGKSQDTIEGAVLALLTGCAADFTYGKNSIFGWKGASKSAEHAIDVIQKKGSS